MEATRTASRHCNFRVSCRSHRQDPPIRIKIPRHFSWPASCSLRRTKSLVAADVVLVVLVAVVVSCSPWMRGAHLAVPEHLVAIRSLGVVNPIVGAYSADSSNNIRPEPERASSAAIVLGAAVTKHFGSLPDLQVRQVDLTRSEKASREVAALHGWPPSHVIMDVTSQGPTLPCLSQPLPAVAELAESDAIVLVYAVEVRHPGSSLAMLQPFFWVLMPLELAVDPLIPGAAASGGESALQVCVVNPRTAETLWSYVDKFVGVTVLQDSSQVDQIMATITSKFQQALHRP